MAQPHVWTSPWWTVAVVVYPVVVDTLSGQINRFIMTEWTKHRRGNPGG